MDEQDNAVPLNVRPFRLKGKTLCCSGQWNWIVLWLQQKPGI